MTPRIHAPGRVLTLGESMLLVTPEHLESLATATRASIDVAGAESTVAVYLSELGHRTSWVSAVGSDSIGDRIVSAVQGAGVDTTLVRRDATAPSGVYFKDQEAGGHTTVHYYRRSSAASGMGPAELRRIPVADFDLVHVSGITAALSSSCAALIDGLLEVAARAGVLTSFDVNHRPGLWSATEAADPLARLANRADVVFVGLDEAHRLWSCSTADEVREIVSEPRTLVVKDGGTRATAFTDQGRQDEPALVVDVLEATGAGDAFAAGYLHGLLTGEPETTRLRIGHLLARASLLTTGDVGIVPDELIAEIVR